MMVGGRPQHLDVLTILANGASPVTMDDPDIHGSGPPRRLYGDG